MGKAFRETEHGRLELINGTIQQAPLKRLSATRDSAHSRRFRAQVYSSCVPRPIDLDKIFTGSKAAHIKGGTT